MNLYGLKRMDALLSAVLLCSGCTESGGARIAWRAVPSVPPQEAGYAKGVSAPFAGIADGTLLMAGGANFPDLPVTEGGRKAFYDTIYRYGDGGWTVAGRLPAEAAYGVSCGLGGSVAFVGGANASGALRCVWRVWLRGGRAVVEELPSLPHAVEQAAGATLGQRIYICGGLSDGAPSDELWSLDTDAAVPCWEQAASLPEKVVQPVMAAVGGYLWLWGGFDPSTGSASGGGYRYDPSSDEWRPVKGHPDGGTFVGASAAALPDGRIVVVGGVDREIFEAALRLSSDRMRAYQLHPAEWYCFQKAVRLFDPASGEWENLGECACTARAGAALVPCGDGVFLLGGELKPGVRTPDNYFGTLLPRR